MSWAQGEDPCAAQTERDFNKLSSKQDPSGYTDAMFPGFAVEFSMN